MRVSLISGSLSRRAGGILPIMQAHARELQRLGADVTVHGVWDEDYESDLEGWSGISTVVNKALVRGVGFAPNLKSAIYSANADILHQHGLWQYPSVVTRTWSKENNKPTVISTQGMLEPWARQNSRYKKVLAELLFERQNLENASAVHCSKAELQGVRSFGVKAPVAVLPNGTQFPDLTSKTNVDRSLSTRKSMLFLGRLHPKKGLVEAIKAWAIAKRSAPSVINEWKFVIAGWDDGGHHSRLLKLITDLGLSNDVELIGPVFGAEKERVLRSASAFILPSYSEGFPMAVLEAMSFALPVFMTSECNISDAFDKLAAIKIDQEPENIAKIIHNTLQRGEEYLQGIGDAGLKFAIREFSWSTVVKQLFTLYEHLLEPGSSAPHFLQIHAD